MEYLTLHNGRRMPALGLGTWDLRGQTCVETIPRALELGYRLIDTAQMYENEREVGQGLRLAGLPGRKSGSPPRFSGRIPPTPRLRPPSSAPWTSWRWTTSTCC